MKKLTEKQLLTRLGSGVIPIDSYIYRGVCDICGCRRRTRRTWTQEDHGSLQTTRPNYVKVKIEQCRECDMREGDNGFIDTRSNGLKYYIDEYGNEL